MLPMLNQQGREKSKVAFSACAVASASHERATPISRAKRDEDEDDFDASDVSDESIDNGTLDGHCAT